MHTVFASYSKYLYITEQERHVCGPQSRKWNAPQTGSWLSNLSRPRQILLKRTAIDLVFVNNTHRIVESGVIHSAISDHSIV